MENFCRKILEIVTNYNDIVFKKKNLFLIFFLVEDCKEVKSDNELSGIYLHSPSKAQKSLKRRQDISSSDEELSPPKKYQKFIKSPRKPEFFDSLVEADNNESPKDDKENDIKSPRNRFAVLSPSKKPKFNLNAPKEVVKSR